MRGIIVATLVAVMWPLIAQTAANGAPMQEAVVTVQSGHVPSSTEPCPHTPLTETLVRVPVLASHVWTTVSSGADASAAQFGSSTAVILTRDDELPSLRLPAPSDSLSVELWLKPGAQVLGTGHVLSVGWPGDVVALALHIQSGTLHVTWESMSIELCNVHLPDNSFTHVAMVVEAAPPRGHLAPMLSVYVNGTRAVQRRANRESDPPARQRGADESAAAMQLALGGSTMDPCAASTRSCVRGFDGTLQEVRVWRTALSPERLRLMMARRAARGSVGAGGGRESHTTPPDLLFHFPAGSTASLLGVAQEVRLEIPAGFPPAAPGVRLLPAWDPVMMPQCTAAGNEATRQVLWGPGSPSSIIDDAAAASGEDGRTRALILMSSRVAPTTTPSAASLLQLAVLLAASGVNTTVVATHSIRSVRQDDLALKQQALAAQGVTLTFASAAKTPRLRHLAFPNTAAFAAAVSTYLWFQEHPLEGSGFQSEVVYFEAAGGSAFVVQSARRAALLAGHVDAAFVAVVSAEVEASLALRRERFEGHTRELVATELESSALELADVAVFPSVAAERIARSQLGLLPSAASGTTVTLPPPSAHPSVLGQCRGTSDVVQAMEFSFVITPSTTRVELSLFCGGVARVIQRVMEAASSEGGVAEWLSVKLITSYAGVPHNATAWCAAAWPHNWRDVAWVDLVVKKDIRGALDFAAAACDRVVVVAQHGSVGQDELAWGLLARGAPVVAQRHDVSLAAVDEEMALGVVGWFDATPDALADCLLDLLRGGYDRRKRVHGPAAAIGVAQRWIQLHRSIASRVEAGAYAVPPLPSVDELQAASGPRPWVTVCIPTHNRGRELLHTLRTIAAQTLPVDVVVVDDATSGAEELAALEAVPGFVKVHGWRFIRLEQNVRASVARNIAAEAATTKYVMFFDDDDFMMPHAMHTMVACAEASGADIVTSWVQRFRSTRADGAGRRVADVWAPSGVGLSTALYVNVFGGGSGLHRRRKFLAAGGYRPAPPGTAHLDYELYAREVAAAGMRLVVVPAPMYEYRLKSRGSIYYTSDSRFRNRGNSLRPFLDSQPHLRLALIGAYAGAEFRGTGNVDGPDQRLVSDGL